MSWRGVGRQAIQKAAPDRRVISAAAAFLSFEDQTGRRQVHPNIAKWPVDKGRGLVRVTGSN